MGEAGKPGGHKVPFDGSYWVIPGRFLAGAYPGSPSPSEAAKKLKGLMECGVRHIINLMEPKEVDEFGRQFVPYEADWRNLGHDRGIEATCVRFPIKDLGVTIPARMTAILDEIDSSLGAGRAVYVHCRGGVGRTGTVVGCYLVRHGPGGQEALMRIQELRRNDPMAFVFSPETKAQQDMVRSWRELAEDDTGPL